jgi:hypothetical protein
MTVLEQLDLRNELVLEELLSILKTKGVNMVRTKAAAPVSETARLKVGLPELPSQEMDVYLATEVVGPAELLQLNAEELVVLRAALRSAIVTSPEIREVLRKRAREVLDSLKKGKAD